MAPADPHIPAERYRVLTELAGLARRSANAAVFRYTMVNETFRLAPFDQAVLAAADAEGRAATVVAASGIALIDRNAPQVQWLERALRRILAEPDATAIRRIDPCDLSVIERQEWEEFGAPSVLWCPLVAADGTLKGGLWLARDEVWSGEDVAALELLADAYAETWLRLEPKPRWRWRFSRSKRVNGGIAAGILVAALIPVRLSVLAPAEIQARNPDIVAAPVDGVIQSVAVEPNATVAAGDLLFRFDDAELRGKYLVASQELTVAEAALAKGATQAVRDSDSNADLAYLQATVDLRKAELAYAQELYQRVEVRATRAGVAVMMEDPNYWRSRPVVAGERVMEIADPKDVEVRVMLPVSNAIVLPDKASVQLYLNISPLSSWSAHLVRADYEAEETPDNSFAFRLIAALDAGQELPRIGLRGTAKIMGDRVPLFVYLLRRPLGVLRQFIGWR